MIKKCVKICFLAYISSIIIDIYLFCICLLIEEDAISRMMAQTQQNTGKPPLKKFGKLDPDAPVLPSLASTMGVEMIVNPEGGMMIIISKDIPETYWWAEYDVDLKQLYFVTISGKIQGLGIKIHDVFEELMTQTKDVRIVKYNKRLNNLVGVPYVVPVVVRKNTLGDPSHD